MANRITQEFNTILNSSDNIVDFYSKRYLSRHSANVNILNCDMVHSISSINMYYRVKGYDFFDENERNVKQLSDVSRNLLGAIGAYGFPLVFSIYGTCDSVRVYFGTNYSCGEQVKRIFSGNMFSASIVNEWIKPSELSAVQMHNGFIVGVSTLEVGAIDQIINSLQQKHYLLNIISVPIPQEQVTSELHNINSLLDRFQRVSRTELSIGSNRVRHFDNDNHSIQDVINLLEKEKQRLQRGQNIGLWYIAIHVSSPDIPTYRELSSVVASAFKKNVNNDIDSSVSAIINVNIPAVSTSTWSLPTMFMGQQDIGGIYRASLLNVADLDAAGSVVALPIYPHAGYLVKHQGDSSVSTGAFSRFAPDNVIDNAFELGRLADGTEYSLSIDAFRQHAFITGATQFGKSTTIQKVLIEGYKRGYPFIVIEAANKGYWKLVNVKGMKNIPIYSVGMDAKDLYINPFQPEDNTRLEFHIQSLINALLSMFDQGDPLPQIITNLVYMCYEKKGWYTRRRISANDNREFPILSDLLNNLDECIADIHYSETGDVKDDIKGVVRVRITALIRQVGELFNSQQNISIKDMFETSAVVELDDFDDMTKPFIASILAMKVNEYTRQCNPDNQLHRLLVIEEAHHILPNPELPTATPNSRRCSTYFANMLAEISVYGTGIIVVDQRASTISQAALANTGTKIVHKIQQRHDIDAVSSSIGLKKHEEDLLNQFSVGEAIIKNPLSTEICRVNISNEKELSQDTHLGCLFCDGCECRDWSNMITVHDIDDINRNGVNTNSLKMFVNDVENEYLLKLSPNEKVCLAGKLVSSCKSNQLILRQQLYDYRESLLGNGG